MVWRAHQPSAPLLYLGELIDLLQSFLYLKASSIACDPIHDSHNGLFDHLPADEALQDLSYLQATLGITRPQLFHLKYRSTISYESRKTKKMTTTHFTERK